MAKKHGDKQQAWWQEQGAKNSHHEPQAGNREGKVAGELLTFKMYPQQCNSPDRLQQLSLTQQHHQLETREWFFVKPPQ